MGLRFGFGLGPFRVSVPLLRGGRRRRPARGRSRAGQTTVTITLDNSHKVKAAVRGRYVVIKDSPRRARLVTQCGSRVEANLWTRSTREKASESETVMLLDLSTQRFIPVD